MTTATAQPSTAAKSGKQVIACQQLTKTFRDFWLRDRARAVDAITFEVRTGEIFGLLGPNGSGKSTTIKMLLGLLRPTRGRIAVFGKPPTDVGVKKRIGYLPEESYLYGFLNAEETLDYYGKLFEIDPGTRKRRIGELLEMVGLTHVAHRPVRDYSKGMQRRIGLAQALINDPDLLILDEPTTGLDPIGTRQVKDLIIELGRRGKTVLLSSHLLADVEDVVDRMVILYGGRIRDEGTAESLLTDTGHTTIETDALDEETLAEIDRLIRERTSGANGVRRVARPRQKLEQLFLNIVERAQRERLETSGALHGGETASFLKADETEPTRSGDALIEDLMTSDEQIEPAEVEPEADQPDQPAERASELIADLVEGEAEPPNAAAPEPEAGDPSRPPEPEPIDNTGVDDDVIGSLLADEDEDGRR